MGAYIAMISSDWNQCLAPCGPFDAFAYHHPGLRDRLTRIFRQYTSNAMTLGQAAGAVARALPSPLTPARMDAYLRDRFQVYTGVSDFIRWCDVHRVLFMINTTGLTGYFQRALALGLLPSFGVLAAHSLVRYAHAATDPENVLAVEEITDKPRHTASMAVRFHIPPERIIIMGDSGGDGPHFEWGARNRATLVGSMVKPSLERYCAERGIAMTHRHGHTYAEGESVDLEKELTFAFTDLIGVVEQMIGA